MKRDNPLWVEYQLLGLSSLSVKRDNPLEVHNHVLLVSLRFKRESPLGVTMVRT
jgi:hypothetical protein